MELFVTILHVVLCIALILVILLQPGKDSTGALMSGGAVNQKYAPRGPSHFLGRATTVVAALFMCTSIFLALQSTKRSQGGVSDIEDAIRQIEAEDAAVGGSGTSIAPSEPEPGAEEPTELAPESPATLDEPAAEGVDGAETIDGGTAETPVEGALPTEEAPTGEDGSTAP